MPGKDAGKAKPLKVSMLHAALLQQPTLQCTAAPFLASCYSCWLHQSLCVHGNDHINRSLRTPQGADGVHCQMQHAHTRCVQLHQITLMRSAARTVSIMDSPQIHWGLNSHFVETGHFVAQYGTNLQAACKCDIDVCYMQHACAQPSFPVVALSTLQAPKKGPKDYDDTDVEFLKKKKVCG